LVMSHREEGIGAGRITEGHDSSNPIYSSDSNT
jgi:hypothetical protein